MTDSKAGNFVWYELLTRDLQAAMAFYGDVVGWKTQPFGESDYTMWVGSQGPLGGVMELPDEAAKMGAPPHWMAHVRVEDVDATCALAKKLGGKIYKEPSDIPTVGRFAVLAHPQGAPISAFKPRSGMELHDPSKPAEICWNELMCPDSQAAFDFYAKLFGWKVLDSMDMGDKGTYRVFGLGEQGLGGFMDTPRGAGLPPMWVFYAEAPSLDATLERASSKGARVMMGPMEVPGGGTIAQFVDPQGAIFALHQAPKK